MNKEESLNVTNVDGRTTNKTNESLEEPAPVLNIGDGMNGSKNKNHQEFVEEVAAERGTWRNNWDFLFSCISLSVGLGNVWRFPYLCYKNGGGIFLVIYLLTMFVCGIPIFIAEVMVGQFLGSGGMTTIGLICPIFKGVGLATMVVVTLYTAYYCIIVAWAIFYLFASMVSIPNLPWSNCDEWWNTQNCWTNVFVNNLSEFSTLPNDSTTSVEEYWNYRVLQRNEGIEYGLGSLQWELAGSLLLGWLTVYIILRQGIHQSGYIIWFTALFPYVIMVILMGKALSLPGASQGLLAYIEIDWSYLKNGQTWLDAVTQNFFAYSVGLGALPALASYNKFNHNSYRDSLITCVVNTCTCLSAGVLVFAILGNMAFIQNVSVDEVVRHGPGLVFITYPELVLKFPLANLWAILFFTMLLVLGIDTQFCSVESLITGLVDNWSKTLMPKRKLFAFAVCVGLFVMGLPMVTNGGLYIFQIFDFYAASGMSLLWICFNQIVVIGWIYGADRFAKDVESMMGGKLNWYWILCWKYLAPLMMAGVFVYFVATFTSVQLDGYTFPSWANHLGLAISFSSMAWVPLYFAYYLLSQPGTFMENLKKGTTPIFKLRNESKNNVKMEILT